MPVERLAGEALVVAAVGSALRDALLALAPAGRVVAEVNELETPRELTARGLGVALIPRSVVATHGDRLAILPLSPPQALPVSLLWRAGDHPTPPRRRSGSTGAVRAAGSAGRSGGFADSVCSMATVSRAAVDAAALRQARVELAVLLRAAARHGFNESIDNHFSLALPGREDLFLLNRYGPHWSEITPADILLIDLEGRVVDGSGDWEVTAFMIHRAVHRARPTARCVLHTHMPHATAVAMTDAGLDTRASQNADMYFHGRVVRRRAVRRPGRMAPRRAIASPGSIGAGATVAFLDNHGVLVIGQTPADAWHKLYMLERACQTDVLAKPTRCARSASPKTSPRTRRSSGNGKLPDGAADAVFAAERRLLERDSPGFLD